MDLQHHILLDSEHLRGNDSLGRYVLLPGDPGRAERLAARLAAVERIDNPRGHHAYLGRLERSTGDPIDVLVISSGMGSGSTEIIVYELLACGARRLIRVGSCGSMVDAIAPGQVVIATGAVRDERTSHHYAPPEFPAFAHPAAVAALPAGAHAAGLAAETFLGICHSKASFYAREFGHGPAGEDNLEYDRWLKRCNVVASEMEASTLFVLATTSSGPPSRCRLCGLRHRRARPAVRPRGGPRVGATSDPGGLRRYRSLGGPRSRRLRARLRSMRLIVQDNLWFRGPPHLNNYELEGRTMIPVEPLLGRTDSSDAAAKLQELQWLLRYTGRTGSGLIVAQEWIRPHDLIDTNLEGWVDLFARHAGRARWLIFYDLVLAVRQRGLGPAPPVDLGKPEILDLWRRDLDYFAQRFFDSPRYWRRDGRPVVYVWALYGLERFEQAFSEARARGIYLLGDVLGSRLEPGAVGGVTGFVSALPGRIPRQRDYGEFVDELTTELDAWSQRADRRRLDFVPAASLQYDDTEFQEALGDRGRPPTRIAARGRADLRTTLTRLASFADGQEVFLGTANNWAEGTTCLPTTRSGARFRAPRIGHYRYEHLEAIREVLFPGVREYDGPRVVRRGQRDGGSRIELVDADFVGEPRRITIRNLDGHKTRWESAGGTA